ncbi:head-tail connector protein [Anaeroselena agilis]|uniref:Head-tail connector protein n=1 Tax=Anaeroselena agilis TaxID=3063788 RepID=A0ABU3NTD5_9FIRM|nr:head-tail connector protein [Selenomonadales bacterium 4137-cl]
MATALSLEDVKLYLRVDSDDEDALLQDLMDGAIGYMQRMTGKVYDPADGVWKMAVKYLCSHWYENRDSAAAGRDARVDHTIDALISHISLCKDYADLPPVSP